MIKIKLSFKKKSNWDSALFLKLRFISRIILYCIFVICLSHCKFKDDNSERIFNLIFIDGGKRNPKIVFTREANLDLTPDTEFFYVVRNGNEEIVAVFDHEHKNLLFKKVFTLLNIGPILYNAQKKKWEASADPMETDALYIIKSLLFIKLGNDPFNSVFIETLSEEPPLELFSVPMVYRNFQLIFDGFSLFKDSKLLKELNRIPISYDPEKNGIRVLSDKPYFDQFYVLIKE